MLDAGGKCHTASGSSISAPIVGGVIAMFLQAARNRGLSLSPSKMKRILVESGDEADDGYLGNFVNIRRAYELLCSNSLPPFSLIPPRIRTGAREYPYHDYVL